MKTAISHFNSHPHEEDDRIRLCFHNVELYFNSHPHEEDDIIQDFPAPSGNISTHILTKRMTKSLRIYRGGLFISTHILTKRMTTEAGEMKVEEEISTHILTKRMTALVVLSK